LVYVTPYSLNKTNISCSRFESNIDYVHSFLF
jgi:hypothetical protein